jgi:predicted acetyltransferase
MQVTLARAGAAEMHIVRNFFVGYFYDMTQYDPNLIINEHGLPMWEPFGLPGPRTADECAPFNWWIRDDCEHYIIRADSHPVGFVIILRDKNHLLPEIDQELMDFYVAPKYRRQGIGQQAARLAFELYQGMWQVFQLDLNTPARVFWQGVINEYTGGQYENLDNGTQQRFRN